jgi:predicted O-methyltransferase YrrM
MDFIAKEIEAYAEQFTREEGELLAALNRETYAKVMTPRMLSGHLQGQVLRMFSQMIRPKNIVEIGTYGVFGFVYGRWSSGWRQTCYG